jgi:hypothetical protein
MFSRPKFLVVIYKDAMTRSAMLRSFTVYIHSYQIKLRSRTPQPVDKSVYRVVLTNDKVIQGHQKTNISHCN